jgi:DNA helicase-2/ATP-dependent DNA helicase PcrA
MRSRLRLRSKGSINQHSFEMVNICTIHSFCYNAWKQNLDLLPEHVHDVTLADKDKEQMIIELLEKDFNFEATPKNIRDRVRDVMSYIQRISYEDMLHVMNYDKLSNYQVSDENDRIYREIRKKMKEKEHIDFNDLIHISIYLLEHDPSFSEMCKSLYRHILVDEFQDMGYLEFQFLKRLADISDKSIERSISCFGDDDQCIYTFKGTSPKIFDWLTKAFPDTETYTIDTNYRSSNSIVLTANILIQGNTDRMRKNIQSSGSVDDEAVQIQMTSDRENEGLFISDQIYKLVNNSGGKIKYKDIAVLCRVNRHLGATKLALKSQGIPYKEITNNDDHIKASKDCKEVLDMLAYFTVLANLDVNSRRSIQLSDDAFRRIFPKGKHKTSTLEYLEQIQKEQGGVGLWNALRFAKENNYPQTDLECDKTVTEEKTVIKTQLTLFNYSTSHSTHANWKHRAQTKLINKPAIELATTFYNTIDKIIKRADAVAERNLPGEFVSKIIDYICKETPYKEELANSKKKGNHADSINDLKRQAQSVLFGSSQRDSWTLWLQKLLTSRKSETIVFSKPSNDSDCVSISSIHQAKGLEWKVVFLSGMNTGILPIHELTSEIVEDERRIAFVGMTRAKEKLFITVWERDETNTSRAQSRFVEEIVRSNPNVKLWLKQTDSDLQKSIEQNRKVDHMDVDTVVIPVTEKKKRQATTSHNAPEVDEMNTSDDMITFVDQKKKSLKEKAPVKKRVVKVIDETKLNRGQKKEIEKSSNMMALWLQKSTVKSKEQSFTVHEDAELKDDKSLKRAREDKTIESEIQPIQKKQKIDKDSDGRKVLADKKITSEKETSNTKQTKEQTKKKIPKKSEPEKKERPKLVLKKRSVATEKQIESEEPEKPRKAQSKSSTKKQSEQKTKTSSSTSTTPKTSDELICELYSSSPVGLQFLIGQYCNHCNEFLTNTYIESTQESSIGFEIPCEFCNEQVEVSMQVIYKLPGTPDPIKEECNRFNKKTIRKIVLTIDECNGKKGEIDTMWLLDNQRDLFWNILYHTGNVQNHLQSILQPLVTEKQKKITKKKSNNSSTKQRSLLEFKLV